MSSFKGTGTEIKLFQRNYQRKTVFFDVSKSPLEEKEPIKRKAMDFPFRVVMCELLMYTVLS